jgi:hypothetical protein
VCVCVCVGDLRNIARSLVINSVLVGPGSHVTCCGVSEDNRRYDVRFCKAAHQVLSLDDQTDCGGYRRSEIRSEMAQWGTCCYLASG